MVMRQMRENTKWIMLVTAVAFVLLMVFQWGMDITGRSGGSQGEIGRVNGTPVIYEAYMNAYRGLYDQVQGQQAEPVNSQQNREIEDAAWDQMVDQILIQQELRRRRIDVTEEEIRQAARFQPPPELRTSPAFVTDGAFDLAKYQEYLATSADPLLFQQLEAYYRDVLPQGKLMRQLATGVYASDGELWSLWRDANESVTVRFVPFDPTVRVPNNSITITEREIERHWDDNRDDFEMPARATVEVVVLPKVLSAADSVAAHDRVASLLEEIRGGAPFDSVGSREATAVQPATFEDLGTFGRGDMTPVFDTAAFTTPIGRAAGPVQTPFGYHLVLVSARAADSATAKHILVPITRTEESEVQMLALADSLEILSEERTLEEAALIMGLNFETVEVTEVFPFVPSAGQVGEGADWAFQDAAPGDVSELFENDLAFYVMELVSSRPSGVLPLEEAEPTVRQILLLTKKVERVMGEAEDVVERVRAGATLSSAAAETGLEVRAPAPFTRQQFVPGLGQQNAAIGAAFGLREGQVSEPVATRDNVFVIEKITHNRADSTAWLAQRDEQRRQFTAAIQQQRVQEWIAGLRATANIVDRRDEVLQPVDADQPLQPNMFF